MSGYTWFQCDAWPCQFTSLAFIFAATTTTAIKITAAATNYVFLSHIHSTRTQWERWRVWKKGQTRSSGLPVSFTVLFIVYNFVSSLPPVSCIISSGSWPLVFTLLSVLFHAPSTNSLRNFSSFWNLNFDRLGVFLYPINKIDYFLFLVHRRIL